MNRSELLRVESYLRRKFGNNSISLKEQKDGSCEVELGDEFIGVVYRDDEDDDFSEYVDSDEESDSDDDDDDGVDVDVE